MRELYDRYGRKMVTQVIQAVRERNSQALQPMVLFVSMVVSMGLTFLSSIITARGLGPDNYGDLKYIQTVWSLLALIITFGYFYSASRVLVLENDTAKCREIYGTLILVSLLMGVVIFGVTALAASPLDRLFHVNVSGTMAQLSPLILIMPLAQSLPLILQSTNQIYLLAVLTGAPVLVYMAAIIVLSRINLITTATVLISQQLSILLFMIVVIILIKPSFRSIGHWWKEIRRQNKAYGSPVYRGSIVSVGTAYLNRLAISYWVDNTAIGFFSLATSLVEPLKLLPNAVGTSSFRSFATRRRISRKVLLTTIIITLTSLIAAILFFGKPLSWIYTTKFNEVGPMATALTLSSIFVGFGDFFNRFMGAHGKGKSLQNASIAYGIANVAGIFFFTPFIGVWGAVISTILAGEVYLLFMLRSYRAFLNEPKQNAAAIIKIIEKLNNMPEKIDL